MFFVARWQIKNMSNLLQEIEAQISGAKTATAKQNVGVVREIGDGVAKIEGLTDTCLLYTSRCV